MNNLSVILYLADVANSFALIAWPLSALTFGGSSIGAVTLTVASASEDAPAAFSDFIGVCKKLVVASLLIFCLLVLIPSKQTIFMIAASEVGQSLLLSDGAQKSLGEVGDIASDSLKLLRQYINEQLEEKKQ